ncbi:MAG: thiamine pyrophosphate-dependent dehydrogenase E1 component subunit alpha [Pseudomonadota bacterium]
MDRRTTPLGDLANPEKFTSPIDIGEIATDTLLDWLRQMLVIRKAEEQLARWASDGVARTPCHLGIGQEACAVGVAAALRASDRVFGGHRGHSQYLAMGGGLTELFAEVLGRSTGASRGMGGSMHLYAGSTGFHGSVPIVAATISIAVGAGLAAKMDGRGDIGVCFFGDGAAEEGVLHESLNLAASQEIPVLFVCENNLYSSHLDIKARQPNDRVARYADAHEVQALTVDGNDVVTTAEAASALIGNARTNSKPGFLELITYRHRGHVGPNEDIDVGVRRTMSDLEAWKRRDPISRLVVALEATGKASESTVIGLIEEIEEAVGAAAEVALTAPYPEDDQLTAFVYGGSAS